MRRYTALATGLALCATLTACDVQGGEMEETGDEVQLEVPPETPGMPGNGMPDTTAQAVWTFLQDADYAENWDFWPGKDLLYTGTEPHGMLLNTYLNAAAMTTVSGGVDAPLASGSMVIKENYAPDSTLAAITVMYKHEGYAPEAGDWFWAKYGPEGDVQAAGHVDSCIQCHSQAAESHDYLMTAMKDAGN